MSDIVKLKLQKATKFSLFTTLILLSCFARAYEVSPPNPQVLTVKAPPSVEKQTTLNFDFYSESLNATYFSGAVNQSRLRFLFPLQSKKLQGYLGVNTSSDFTNNSTQRFADSYVSPTAGLLFKPWSFMGFFAEYRRLYRTVNNELPSEENDPRYGVYIYHLELLPLFFSTQFEFYGEAVALTRFTSKPISTAWLKYGKEFQLVNHLSLTPYVEFLHRASPDIMLGIDETSGRAGGKLKWQSRNFSIQVLGYNRFASSSVPEGWEAFLVLAADGQVLPWK